jgi:hypothetical protein
MLGPWRVLLIAVSLLLLPAGPALGEPAGGRSSAPAETGRYYVVGEPVHGQPEYLYAIAVSTLHNGNRYREIFRLNRGRVQPDGVSLTDPAEVLHPGWVLALPRDARGPRVMTGPLPLGRPSSSPVAAPPPAPVTIRTTADGEPLLTYGGLTVAVLLVGFAVFVLRRRPSASVKTKSLRGGTRAFTPPRMPGPSRTSSPATPPAKPISAGSASAARDAAAPPAAAPASPSAPTPARPPTTAGAAGALFAGPRLTGSDLAEPDHAAPEHDTPRPAKPGTA